VPAKNAIECFLNPQSIAVVGAGERPTSSGGAVLRNLRASGYTGRIVPVNPKGGEIDGLKVAVSLRDMESPADLVAVLVRPDSILDLVTEAADTGHKNILILPGGFAEAGENGRARDAALRELAAARGLTIGGPNCAGVINLLDPKAPFAATFFRDMPKGGAVAMISQSGAIIEEAIDASHAYNIPLGAVVSVGNSMHLGIIEYLDQLGRDERCKAILLYVESFGDAVRFGEAARTVVKSKPVIALIGGRTAAGRDAAFRHTGSRPADDAVTDEFCRRSGIVRVRSLRRLLLAGKAFGAFPQGIGKRVLLLSNSGGPGVLAADQATDEGLVLPELPAAMAEKLRGFLPPEAAIANPIDLLADARADRFAAQSRTGSRKGLFRCDPDDPRRAFHGGSRCGGRGARRSVQGIKAADPAFHDGHTGAWARLVFVHGASRRADVQGCRGNVHRCRSADASSRTQCGALKNTGFYRRTDAETLRLFQKFRVLPRAHRAEHEGPGLRAGQHPSGQGSAVRAGVFASKSAESRAGAGARRPAAVSVAGDHRLSR
jgi:succinyl-CoA synthetase alpha subunit